MAASTGPIRGTTQLSQHAVAAYPLEGGRDFVGAWNGGEIDATGRVQELYADRGAVRRVIHAALVLLTSTQVFRIGERLLAEVDIQRVRRWVVFDSHRALLVTSITVTTVAPRHKRRPEAPGSPRRRCTPSGHRLAQGSRPRRSSHGRPPPPGSVADTFGAARAGGDAGPDRGLADLRARNGGEEIGFCPQWLHAGGQKQSAGEQTGHRKSR